MLHTLGLQSLPNVSSIYRIERQTTWQTCDRENILVVMEKGRCLFTLGGKQYTALPCDLIFIPGGQDYKREPLDDAPATFTYFHFSMGEEPVQRSAAQCTEELSEQQARVFLSPDRQLPHPAPRAYLFTQTPLTEQGMATCREALNEYERGTVESRAFYTLHTALLLALATRENVRQLMSSRSQPADIAVPPKLRQAILYIRKNHDRALTVGEVCLEAGISRQHLIRLFRAESGMTPIQYINHTKIMHAKDLLWRNHQLSVKELAYELGFSDEHYFSRIFARIVGESPSEFRLRVRRFSDEASQPR